MTKKYISVILKTFLLFLTPFFCANISICSEEQEHTQSAQEFQSPLHEAARSGDLSRIRLLLSHGFAVGALDNAQQTPLHIAVKNNNLRVAECLVRHGAHIDTHDGTRKRPFHDACENGHMEIVTYLFCLGADINAHDKNHMSPLHYASENGHWRVVQFLLENETLIIHHKNSRGYTALHLAAENGHTEVVQCLLRAGADIESRIDTGECTDGKYTALHSAAENGHTEVVRCLLRAGADIETRTALPEESDDIIPYGYTALHLASRYGHVETVKLLIQHNADINAGESEDKSTPLYEAIENGHLETVQCLIQAGADTQNPGPGCKTALHHACENDNIEIVEFLLNNGQDQYIDYPDGIIYQTPLHGCSMYGSLPIFKLLLGEGAQILTDVDYQTPLLVLLDELELPCQDPPDSHHYRSNQKLLSKLKYYIEFDAPVTDEEKSLLNQLCPEHASWLQEKKQAVKTLLQDKLELPSDIVGLLHEFIFNVEKKRKRDTETDQESNKKSRN